MVWQKCSGIRRSYLDIEGTLSYTLGQHPKYELSRKIRTEFEKKAKELTLLQDSIKAIDLVGYSLSTNEGKDTKFKILETDIIFPNISINGGAELAEDVKTNSIYMKGRVSVELKPLIGIQIKLDLLQAVAAMYASETVADAIRKELARREKLVKQGGNGAYARLTLDLIVKGELDLSLVFESNAEKTWNWRVEGQNEVKLSLDLNANARAGVRFDIIEGVFALEGSFAVSGKAKAEGIIAFDLTPQNRVEMIFYHHGIKIELGVSYNGGIVNSSKDADVSEDGDGSRMELNSGELSIMEEKEKGDKHEWIIHEKLTKEKSPYRFIIL